MTKYSYRLTEEIARWAFEVRIRENPQWWVAFTNPTAGPWKRIESRNEKNERGEVYRFDREEARPDIILINDTLHVVLIIEAKDTFSKLMNENQMKKSCEVAANISTSLSGIKGNTYWGCRYNYLFLNGLLWGTENIDDSKKVNDLFKLYNEQLSSIKSKVLPSPQIGIQVLKDMDANVSVSYYSSDKTKDAEEILQSFE